MKRLLNPMISGLLEVKPELSWTFEKFFAEALKIAQKVRVNVFDAWSGKLIDIFLDPSDR